MNAKAIACACFMAVLIVGLAQAQPDAKLLPSGERVNDGKEKKIADKDKKAPEKKLTEPPQTSVFDQRPSLFDDSYPGFTPQMLGDKQPYFARQRFSVLGFQTIATQTVGVGPPLTTTTTTATTQTRTQFVPIPTRGAFNIAENASPMPQDRVFLTYNHYSSLRSPEGGTNGPTSTTLTNVTTIRANNGIGTVTTTTTTFIPGTPKLDLHREVFGFEKSFLDGFASMELRLPLLQQPSGVDAFATRAVGDLTLVGKYAVYLDRPTGNVISGGLALTAPTGNSINTIDGNIRSALLQPFVGYIWNGDRWYVHGFHSVAIPTDARDLNLLFNDVGIGYWLYRGEPDRPLQFIAPTAEVHVTTPLDHRSATDPLVMRDTVVLTSGVHFGLYRNSTLTFGAATPVTAPRVFNVEAFVQYNLRY